MATVVVRQLHQLCRLFLEWASYSEDAGPHSFRAFLLDMNKLFEEFVCQILRERAPGNATVETQVSLDLDMAKKIPIRPDIIVRQAGQISLVADCKYKRLEPDDFRNYDIYQLLAYCTATAVSQGILVYPKHIHHIYEQTRIKNTGITIRQFTIDLSEESELLIRRCNEFADRVFAISDCVASVKNGLLS